MSLGIMITDKPKWCRLMESGDKTIEVRKNKALANAIKNIIAKYGKCLIVVCESGTHGKVPFQFWCDKVEDIIFDGYGTCLGYRGTITPQFELSKRSCLYSFDDIDNYLKGKNGYAIHISKLEVFEKPKELSEFMVRKNSYGKIDFNATDYYLDNITKAPQNYCWIEIGD